MRDGMTAIFLAAVLAVSFPGVGSAADAVPAIAGRIDGSWHWRMPDTPNGLKPLQSWHATGSAPNGDIYVGGMDHVTNSALYRLKAGTNSFAYIGDAKSASVAAGNWKPGETAEKFHTRPTWHHGKMYVATMDYSALDAGYLRERGFHWYAYDPLAARFADLSAAEPGGVGAPHLGIVKIASDPVRNLLYGAAVPTGQILRYDVANKRTTVLGRPQEYDRPYPYTGRFMWLDSRGRLFFSAGNSGLASYPPQVYARLYIYEPGKGFRALNHWKLKDSRAIETGQCIAGGKTCYVADDQSRVYRFENTGPTWTYIGQIVKDAYVWVFQVNPEGTKIYAVTSQDGKLYEYDIRTRTSRLLCKLADLDPSLSSINWNTGYDAWDDRGRFFFTSAIPYNSSAYGSRNLVVWAIDPERLKAALHLTP